MEMVGLDSGETAKPKRSRKAAIQAKLEKLDHEPTPVTPQVIMLNPNTGNVFNPAAEGLQSLSPQTEYATRLFATGKFSAHQAAAHAGMSYSHFHRVINSPPGQALINQLRSIQEEEFQSQFQKVIEVVGAALDHQDPAIALAGANLWLKACRKQKVEVEITAEDLVQKIMGG